MGIKRLRCSVTHSGISDKNWKRTGIENLLRKLQETGARFSKNLRTNLGQT